MKFSSHQAQIADLIAIALTKNKVELINKFKNILGKCDRLFESPQFVFWLRQLGSISPSEIPITKYGLQESFRSLYFLQNANRHSFKSRVLGICEKLFTYSQIDDLCPLQTNYHYYVYLPSQKVFKESEMGDCNLKADNISIAEIRIAKISELSAHPEEYI